MSFHWRFGKSPYFFIAISISPWSTTIPAPFPFVLIGEDSWIINRWLRGGLPEPAVFSFIDPRFYQHRARLGQRLGQGGLSLPLTVYQPVTQPKGGC